MAGRPLRCMMVPVHEPSGGQTCADADLKYGISEIEHMLRPQDRSLEEGSLRTVRFEWPYCSEVNDSMMPCRPLAVGIPKCFKPPPPVKYFW